MGESILSLSHKGYKPRHSDRKKEKDVMESAVEASNPVPASLPPAPIFM